MRCATWDAARQVILVDPPPADLSTCALLIPESGDSLNNPFMLSAEDGLAIAAAIVGVWIVGFGARVLIRVLGH
jgi:uncharacterized protein (UPF0210 family)